MITVSDRISNNVAIRRLNILLVTLKEGETRQYLGECVADEIFNNTQRIMYMWKGLIENEIWKKFGYDGVMDDYKQQALNELQR